MAGGPVGWKEFLLRGKRRTGVTGLGLIQDSMGMAFRGGYVATPCACIQKSSGVPISNLKKPSRLFV